MSRIVFSGFRRLSPCSLPSFMLSAFLLLVFCVLAAGAARVGHAAPQAEPVAARADYVCPMHPQIRGEAGDSCPICGMRLVQRAPAVDGDTDAAAAAAAAAAAKLTTPAAAEVAPPDLHHGHGHDHGPNDDHTEPTPSAPALRGTAAASSGAYVCPMHPQIRGDAGDSCPICGMALVQREASSDAMSEAGTKAEEPGLAISAVALQRLGVRTGLVERRQLKPVQRAAGRVLALPAGQRRVQARVEGWLERLHVRAVGEQVSAGQVLAEIYSPEIERIRPEFALGEAAAAGAAERLRRLGLAAADIERIREGGRARFPLRAPVSGVIRAIDVREGARVSAESVLFDIDGLGRRWIEARLPLAQAIALGEVASARLRLPGSAETISLEGVWERLPQLDPVTQTQALRLAVDAEQVALPLEAYVELALTGAPRPAQLLIPRSAVIRTAEGARVVQRAANGQLRPRAVSLGAFAGDQVEVISGLNEGDAIVVTGQFLLDAEADLTGALQRLFGSEAASSATGHDHEH